MTVLGTGFGNGIMTITLLLLIILFMLLFQKKYIFRVLAILNTLIMPKLYKKDIAQLKQICTQSGGLRPFGVSLLVAGVDEGGLKLFETDPIGIYFQYKATAIGEGENEVEQMLEKHYSHLTPRLRKDVLTR